jgi:DNA-binding transcriptional LysR family regulator
MTLQQLRYATEIARCGSISEAAGKLFISQPSLSNSVRELESDIGVIIFARTSKGVTVTAEGSEFLGYARQILEQADLLESRYRGAKIPRQLFSVSTQHYAFVVNAFVETIQELGADEYECVLRETRTHEIIEDVRNSRSEIGVIYLNDFNRKVMHRLLQEARLKFMPLFGARPHVFISAFHPLAERKKVSLEALEAYPCLSFEQGEHNSFHFSEEIQSTLLHKKSIKVSDRATLFNLLIGLNGYTISTGILTSDLNGNDIVAVPLALDEVMTVGYVIKENAPHSLGAKIFLKRLKEFKPTGNHRKKL